MTGATETSGDTPAGAEAAPRSQFGLLGERRFGPFFLTQFAGALNDNVFKQALIGLAAFHSAAYTSLAPSTLVNIAGALFILPFFLLSATAGQLADKFEKSRMIRLIKVFEIAVMTLGAVGFATHNVLLLLAALFLMGVHSTFFGPVKYAILPQHLAKDELVGGNALVETGTFAAILAGTIAGGLLVGIDRGITLWVPVATVAIAVLGYLASRGVPRTPAPAPALRVDWNPLTETWRNLAFLAKNEVVFESILGISWFWFVGTLFLAQLPVFAKEYLGGAEGSVAFLLAVFSVGIGAGSLACERLSDHKVEIGLVPFGSIGITLFALDLYFASPAAPGAVATALGALLAHAGTWRLAFDLFGLGFFGGLFIVPLYALVQTRSDPAHQSRVIAGNNIVNAIFIVLASALAGALLAAGGAIPQLFLIAALANAIVAVYIYRKVPEFLIRFLAWLLVHSIYRLDRRGLANIPAQGPALLVCNHVSFVDAVVIMAASRRPIRFVMDHQIFRTPLLGFVFREARAIPIAPAKADSTLLERAYDEIARALAAGELVAIFPEGRITDTGDLYPFRGGVTRILGRTPVPVVPMALQGLWGSFFSRIEGRAMARPFRRGLFTRIALVADAPWPPDRATPAALEAHVRSLRGDRR